jgi:hypothetical protein
VTAIRLGAASWILAKANIQLQLAASVSLDSHGLPLSDKRDLLIKDVWMHMGHDFHFSFRISFDRMSSMFGMPTENALTDFIASVLTQAPVSRVRRNMNTANRRCSSSSGHSYALLRPFMHRDLRLTTTEPTAGAFIWALNGTAARTPTCQTSNHRTESHLCPSSLFKSPWHSPRCPRPQRGRKNAPRKPLPASKIY